MAELVRTNDPGVVAVVECLLGEADIGYQIADRNMSVIEGSIGAIRMRVLVSDQDEEIARQLLTDADLGVWLRHAG